jgi:hypothetical protein
MNRLGLVLVINVLMCSILQAQEYKKPLVSAIKETDLKTDMYQMAADQFWGRESGTLDELKASVWLANKAAEAGMKPAGDNGTFFQFFYIYRHQVTTLTTLSIGANGLKLWSDYLIAEPVNAEINSEIVYADSPEPEDLSKYNIAGKVVAINPTSKGILRNMTLFDRRYPGFIQKKYYDAAVAQSAKAIIFITDSVSERSWAEVLPQMTRGTYGIEGFRDQITKNIPVIWIKKENIGQLKGNPKIALNLTSETYKFPSVNVIGKIEGTDPKLKNEYVLLSGHTDHDGIRQPVKGDTIYNGADDNASTCVAMLAIARAYKQQPSKRSILFVFHGSEERGLLGSRWHVANPVVAKESIVAVLNGDMVGRNNTNEAALLGGNAPHKNSDDLVKMAEQANDESTKFTFLRDWDTPEHAEYFYFRSDHLPYAKAGIPAIFFTSVLHSQYHTPQDESENINFSKLYKMTEWIYRTSWKVANETQRPRLNLVFKLER